VALPLLDAMVPSMTALARTPAEPVRRLGFVYMPMGCDLPRWTPPGGNGLTTVMVCEGYLSCAIAWPPTSVAADAAVPITKLRRSILLPSVYGCPAAPACRRTKFAQPCTRPINFTASSDRFASSAQNFANAAALR